MILMNEISSSMHNVWQQIIALDASYMHQKAYPNLSYTECQLYLRRRNQLAQQNFKKLLSVKESQSATDLRIAYLAHRRIILNQKYGNIPSPRQSTRTSSAGGQFSPFNVLLDRYQREDSRPTVQRSESDCSFGSGIQTRLVSGSQKSTVSDGYAFSGIEIILDHHKASITRIRFAHNESTRLAVASADGSVSICCLNTVPETEPLDTITERMVCDVYWLPSPTEEAFVHNHPPAAVMDLVWSAANNFLVSACLDGSLSVWEVDSRTLTRRIVLANTDVVSASRTGFVGIIACELHPGNNNFLAVADTKGAVQILNLSTGKVTKDGRDQLHPISQNNIAVSLPCRSREDLSHYLGRGCVTALTFESASGVCLWVGTDQGLIQSYTCHPASGKLVRSRRLQLDPSAIPEAYAPALGVSDDAFIGHIRPLTRVVPQNKRRTWFPSANVTPLVCGFLPSVTSLVCRSWLSQSDSSTYLLANVAGFGLLFFRAVTLDGQLLLQRRFSLKHTPVCVPPASNYGLHLLHACFAPLISFRSGACAVSAGEDGNVYVFEVLSSVLSSMPGSCVTFFQGHIAPVVDVLLSWDESVLASADEAGQVIFWRRKSTK